MQNSTSTNTPRAVRDRSVRRVVLGFKPKSTRALIAEVQRGLEIETLDRLLREMDFSVEEMAQFTQIAPRTLARRRRAGKLDLAESERILRLTNLLQLAAEVIGSVEAGREWLKTPKRALGGSTPVTYAHTELGAREVEDLLGRIEHGVFA